MYSLAFEQRKWPIISSGEIPGTEGETWQKINT